MLYWKSSKIGKQSKDESKIGTVILELSKVFGTLNKKLLTAKFEAYGPVSESSNFL